LPYRKYYHPCLMAKAHYCVPISTFLWEGNHRIFQIGSELLGITNKVKHYMNDRLQVELWGRCGGHGCGMGIWHRPKDTMSHIYEAEKKCRPGFGRRHKDDKNWGLDDGEFYHHWFETRQGILKLRWRIWGRKSEKVLFPSQDELLDRWQSLSLRDERVGIVVTAVVSGVDPVGAGRRFI